MKSDQSPNLVASLLPEGKEKSFFHATRGINKNRLDPDGVLNGNNTYLIN